MSKEIFVTDKFMIQSLTFAKHVLETTGYRMSDKELEDMAETFKNSSLE